MNIQPEVLFQIIGELFVENNILKIEINELKKEKKPEVKNE